MLDVHRVVKHRLFRESCLNHKGNYVKVCERRVIVTNPIWRICKKRIGGKNKY